MDLKRAVVLSGGGARGAYEAGVLRFILEEVPRQLGHRPHFDLICGTSVGALHACYLAATAHEGASAGARLAELWSGFRIGELLPFSTSDLLRLPRRLMGLPRVAAELRTQRLPDRLYGLLDTRALERTVIRAIPWRVIQRNLRAGLLDALCVTATQISTGRATVFVEDRDRAPLRWRSETWVVPHPARILPVHALASAAIPLLFPAVRIGATYYADGGLRLNTPLVPAVRLGADRVLVIGLQHAASEEQRAAQIPQVVAAYGNPLFLFGKVLNALLLDHVSNDLRQMHMINELLRAGEAAFGPDFLERMNVQLSERQGQFKRIDDVLVRPSQDLGTLAGRVLEEGRAELRLSPLLRLFLRSLGPATSEADLLSYLLFDAAYAAPLVELGYADARRQEEELLRFFSDEPMAA